MKDEELSELLLRMVESAKENKQVIKSLKNGAVHAQLYELAAEFRDIEVKSFPKSEGQKQAEATANEINTLFRMAEYNVSNKECWLFHELIKMHLKRKGKETISDVISLKFKANEYFEN